MKKIVVITGVSTGLGRAFAEALLHEGYTVAGTVRKPEAKQAFEDLAPGRAFAQILDVTDGQRVTESVAEVESKIGPIYALINNAGYGHEGTLEESPMEQLRQQFDAQRVRVAGDRVDPHAQAHHSTSACPSANHLHGGRPRIR